MSADGRNAVPRWRRLLALAVLVGGLGWVIGAFWRQHGESRADLTVALHRDLNPADVEVWISVRNGEGEDVWEFRGRLRESRQRFRPRLLPGDYEVHAAARASGRDLSASQGLLEVPGTPLRVEISRTETRILH